jgi:hypothetical protein
MDSETRGRGFASKEAKGRGARTRTTAVRVSVPLDFEAAFGVSASDLSARGVDPAQYAQEHALGNPVISQQLRQARASAQNEDRKREWAEEMRRRRRRPWWIVEFLVFLVILNPLATSTPFEHGENLAVVSSILGACLFAIVALGEKYGQLPSVKSLKYGPARANYDLRWVFVGLTIVGIVMMIIR